MSKSLIVAGIDVGSLSTDAVVLIDGEIAAYIVVPTLSSSEAAAGNAYGAVLESASLGEDQVDRIVATGYGRRSIDYADKAVTEITCHALGARELFSEANTVMAGKIAR